MSLHAKTTLATALAPAITAAWLLAAPYAAHAENANDIVVPVNRSAMITLPAAMAEVTVADPSVADVHPHNATHLTVMAKHTGHTSIRIMGKDGKLMRDMDVTVSYDLPAIRHALKNFLPDEVIGVEMVNTGIALTGQISSAAVGDKAIRIVKDFIHTSADQNAAPADGKAQPAALTGAADEPTILNFMQVTSGQQVMLRVRVGEIQRSALKELGVDLNYISQASGTGLVALGTGGGIASIVAPALGQAAVTPGVFLLPGGNAPTNTQGVLTGRWQPNGPNGNTVSGLLKALEQDGLFKVLAEPNLVAISGEEADFLSGGEIPIPVVQGSNGGNNNVTIQYKPFGVAVKFTPFVLSENRIRMMVQPEVSQISSSNAVQISGFNVPSIDTRRAKTTVELAPGESFMIAGLINDQMRATINQLPGVKDLPVLGALFRSTEFQRNQTELVIAVTPYIVDPLKSSDVKLPTDNFRPATQMEMFFLGALGSQSGDISRAKTQALEGPIGFMVD
jgi:pilus assembly protein CpaC